MYPRQKGRCRFPASADHAGFVREPLLLQPFVGAPSICDNHGPRFDRHLDEREERLGGGIRNPTHPNPTDPSAVHLRRYDQQSLIPQVPTASSGLNTADERFVYLHFATQPTPVRPHHRTPQFLETGPSGFVAPQLEQALQSQSADSVLLVGDPPHGPEPSPQRKVTPVKNRPRCHGGLVSAPGAHQQASAGFPSTSGAASHANKPRRPAIADQVCPARRLCGKPFLEFGKGSRIVLHG